MEKDDDRLFSCLTLIQGRCPNKEIAERVSFWQEVPDGKDLDPDDLSEIEQAHAYCRECTDYQKDIS